jgi:hypothetical protein
LTQSFGLAHELLPLGFKLTHCLGALLGIPKGTGRLLLQPRNLQRSLLLHLLGRQHVTPPGLVLAGPGEEHDDNSSQ